MSHKTHFKNNCIFGIHFHTHSLEEPKALSAIWGVCCTDRQLLAATSKRDDFVVTEWCRQQEDGAVWGDEQDVAKMSPNDRASAARESNVLSQRRPHLEDAQLSKNGCALYGDNWATCLQFQQTSEVDTPPSAQGTE